MSPSCGFGMGMKCCVVCPAMVSTICLHSVYPSCAWKSSERDTRCCSSCALTGEEGTQAGEGGHWGDAGGDGMGVPSLGALAKSLSSSSRYDCFVGVSSSSRHATV